MPDDVTLLKQLPLFRSLNDADLTALAGVLKRVYFDEGRTICKYGDPGDTMYFICSGAVRFFHKSDTGDEIPLEEIGAGRFFGEVATLTGGPRTATAVVTKDMIALELKRKDLRGFLQNHPDVMMALLGEMAGRLRRSGDQLRHTPTRNANDEVKKKITPLDRFIHRIATFSGSFPFLAIHAVLFGLWIGGNLWLGRQHAFDPYPFNLLALVIAVEAMYFSSIVLNSQNRQADREKIRNEIEYDANVNAEREVAHLHQKLDEMRAELLQAMKEQPAESIVVQQNQQKSLHR